MPLSKPSVAAVSIPNARFVFLPSVGVLALMGTAHTEVADAGAAATGISTNIVRIAIAAKILIVIVPLLSVN